MLGRSWEVLCGGSHVVPFKPAKYFGAKSADLFAKIDIELLALRSRRGTLSYINAHLGPDWI